VWPAVIDLKFARPFPPCLVHTIFYRLWLLCVQADLARAIKEECEGELAVAMPILEDALAALDTIKEADITYIRKLGNPPGAIKLVMEVGHLLELAYSSADGLNGRQRTSAAVRGPQHECTAKHHRIHTSLCTAPDCGNRVPRVDRGC